MNLEHLLVFWATGAFSICMLGLLAYITVFGVATPASGINFVIFEAQEIAARSFPAIGTLFLIIGSLMLFSTQMTVMDATSRIMSENLLIMKRASWAPRNLPKIYYSFLWIQIAFGIIIFLTDFREPLFLLILEAVINAFAMFVHIGLTLWLNLTSLEKNIRPGIARVAVLLGAFLFFGYFTSRVILDRL